MNRPPAFILPAVFVLFGVAACSTPKPELITNFNVALDLAATLEGAYSARPSADPKVVLELSRLLTTAQAAVASWSASTSPSDQAIAEVAISALIAYEASASHP